MLSDGRFTYSRNAENRLITVEETNKQKLEFTYDYMGCRVEKKVYSWDTDWVLDKTEKFVYDSWNVIAVVDAGNALQKSYVWGEDLSGSLQGAGGVGGLLAVTDSTNTYLPAYDANGNVMAYVDTSDGSKVAEYEYDPFGRTIVKDGSKADDFVYRFSTKPLDETGLYYYGYRYYVAESGRWLNRDPIAEDGVNNLYAYVYNDAVNEWDYLGMKDYNVILALGHTGDVINVLNDSYGEEACYYRLFGIGCNITDSDINYLEFQNYDYFGADEYLSQKGAWKIAGTTDYNNDLIGNSFKVLNEAMESGRSNMGYLQKIKDPALEKIFKSNKMIKILGRGFKNDRHIVGGNFDQFTGLKGKYLVSAVNAWKEVNLSFHKLITESWMKAIKQSQYLAKNHPQPCDNVILKFKITSNDWNKVLETLFDVNNRRWFGVKNPEITTYYLNEGPSGARAIETVTLFPTVEIEKIIPCR